jgi:DNA recombination protein RmuC
VCSSDRLGRPGLAESIQREYRVVVAGPTTLAAMLNSLQMGFRTLAVEKRTSEVWRTLGLVKAEFGKFGDLLDKTRRKLQEAADTVDDASRKTKTIRGKLAKVEELPGTAEAGGDAAERLLGFPEA